MRAPWIVALLLAPALASAQPAEAPDPSLPKEAPARSARPPARPPVRVHVPPPPVAKKVPAPVKLHGRELPDDYAWLKDKKDPQVLAYLEAENVYTAAMMAPTKALQERLYAEMLGRIQEDDVDVPVKNGAYFYAWKTEKGKPHKMWQRWKVGADGNPAGDPEVILDVNALAEGHVATRLGVSSVSDDGRRLLYTVDQTGGLDYALFVKDLASGQILDGPVAEVSGASWTTDGKHIVYTTMDAAKRSATLWSRTVGQKGAAKRLYDEKDARFELGVERSKDRAWVIITAGSHTTTEVWTIPAGKPEQAPRSISGRRDGVEISADIRGDTIFFQSNETGRTWAIFTAPVADPKRAAWKELVPARPDVNLDGFDLTRSDLVLFERAGGLRRIRFLGKGRDRLVSFAEPTYFAAAGPNPELDAPAYRITYTSPVTPTRTIDIDLASRAQTVRKEDPVPGYDPSRYVAERITVRAADGALVPISLVYKKGLRKNGKNPLLLYGYGAYGISSEPKFQPELVSLLDRGMVYAIAHVRGGGDLGKPWHDAGRMMNKKNTFTDFIAAAEGLIAQKYTSPKHLAIYGASAGGLLIGAVLNMRPDLFRVALPRVPFVDAINSMLDESLPLTITEFEEWGNPKKKDEFDYMASYSPYDNVKRQKYPAILIRTGLNDNQVLFHEPAKFTARLRASKTDRNPLLLVVNMGAGHGGASGRYDRLRDVAHDWAFMLTQLGIRK